MKANNGAAIYSMNYEERIFRRGELSIAISEHLNDPNNSRLKNLRRCRRNFVSGKISSKSQEKRQNSWTDLCITFAQYSKISKISLYVQNLFCLTSLTET